MIDMVINLWVTNNKPLTKERCMGQNRVENIIRHEITVCLTEVESCKKLILRPYCLTIYMLQLQSN